MTGYPVTRVLLPANAWAVSAPCGVYSGVIVIRLVLVLLLFVVSLCSTRAQSTSDSNSPIRVSPEEARSHLVSYVAPKIPGDLVLNHPAVVKLQGVIGKNGKVSSAKVLEGHVLLYGAALDAVRQWRYKPFVIKGRRFEVEAEISVIFEPHTPNR